jgi:CubicO group peptidase (beta-lactamase class C family)
MRKLKSITQCVLLLVFASTVQAAPTINPADDAEHLASITASPLFWTPEQQVAGYRNYDRLAPSRLIARGDKTFPLPRALQDLGEVELKIESGSMTVNDYFEKQSVAGLLVVKDGKILYERYGLGNTPDSRWVSFSVSKSVVSLLIGAAVKDGFIESLDEKVTDYVPRLKGSPYDESSIRNIMQMSSGVAWNEDYADPKADINQDWTGRQNPNGKPASVNTYNYLRRLPREAKPGEIFNYNTAETNLVGDVLRAAIGNNLATYLTNKVWQPFGMEKDANWLLTEDGGGEYAGCCISATLRDYARIGLFAMNNGQLADGTEVLPKDWMKESTAPSKGSDRYGYMWWLGKANTYEASGIFGQGIFIAPDKNVVIAIHSARPDASRPKDWALQNLLYRAILNHI